jgi:DNA-binding CsgD family transcriptional regulator
MKTETNILTDRERQVALLVTRGKTSAEIAKELGLAKLTVESHRKHIYWKLDAKNIADLVMMVADKRISFNVGKKLLSEAAEKKKLLVVRKKVRELTKENKELKATIEHLEKKD